MDAAGPSPNTPAPSNPPHPRLRRRAGTSPSADRAVLALCGSILILYCAIDNLTVLDVRSQKLSQAGVDPDVRTAIGLVELALALMFLSHRYASSAAIVLTGCLGAVAVVHVRAGLPGPAAVHFVTLAVVWIIIWRGRRKRVAAG